MLGINEMNQELVRAFNINLCYNDIAITNLTVQNLDGKDHIIISFDKSMKHGQCMNYLSTLKNKIIKRFYKDEKAANVSYNLQSFPFNFNKGRLDNKGKRFSVEIDEGVVFNLKCYLAKALAGDVKEKMGREFGVQYAKGHVYDISFDRSSYLYCMRFNDWKLKVYFINSFSSKIARYEENAPRDYLEIIGNCVYIKKSIFDNIEFIKDIEAHNASLICRDFQTPSSKDKGVENLKFQIISFIRKTGIPVHSVIRTSYEGSNEDSVLIPIVAQNKKVDRLLNDNDAYRISSAFDMEILSNVSESISARLPKSGSFDGVIYGIDFSDLDISYCVMNKIMESSVINARHKLSIDPGLRFQALSPAQSPFNSPMNAGPSGLRTPPNQRKKDTDSGYDSNSPPKPKDSGAQSSSGGPGPSSKVSQIQLDPPTRSPDGALDGPPRQWSEREEETGRMFQLLLGEIGQASTSSQQTDMPSSSYTYIDKRDESMPEDSYFLPSMLTSFPHVITPSVRYGIPRRPILLTTKNDQKSSSREFSARSPCFEDVNILGMKSEEHDKSEQGACSQVGVRALEGAQADDESMPIEIRDQQVGYRPSVPYRRRGEMTCRPSSILFPKAWNNSIFSDLGVSEDSPKDTENICNEEHKEQKVIDKSDQKSSDECSEAKSQESESPKKHGGGVQKIKSFFSSLSKPKQHDASLKRHDVGRDTTRSTPETPVTEKPPVPKAFFSFPGRRKAKSNPPSEVTSPTHEGGPEWQQRLNPDQREELRPLLSPELQKKLDSNSLSPEDEQLKHLLYTPSGQEKMKKNFESQEENLRRSVNAQLPANPSSKKVDRDSGFCSMGSPAVPHKGSVSSKVKECYLQQAKYMSKALGKN